MRFITSADGLARDDLHTIVQDRMGILWFGTSEGVSRFDGVQFRNYRVEDGVPGRDVHSILQARDGSVWIATSGGLARFNRMAPSGGKAFVYFPLTTVAGGVDRILQDRDGSIWAGSYLGLFRVQADSDKGKVERIDLKSATGESIFAREFAGAPDPHVPIYAIFQDSAGSIFVGTSEGLFVRSSSAGVGFERIPELAKFTVHSLAEDADHRLWVGTQAGLIRALCNVRNGRFQIERRYTTRDGLPDNVVKTILITQDRQLWVGTSTGLAKKLPTEQRGAGFRSYAIAGGLKYGDIESLSQDSAGNLWVATDGGGAVKITVNGFVSFDEGDGFVPAYVGSLSLDRAGNPLVLSRSNGDLILYRSDGFHFTGFRLAGPPGFDPSFWVPWHQVIVESRSGDWWAASYQGLLRYAPPSRSIQHALSPDRIIGTANGLPDKEVIQVYEDSQRRLWIGTFSGGTTYSRTNAHAGISVVEPGSGTVRTFSQRDGLPALDTFKPRGFFQDRAGQIWIEMHRTGIARFRNGRFQVFTDHDGVPFGGIRQIYQDAEGHLWLASTSGGLGRVEDPAADKLNIKIYTTSNGLSSDEIQTITEDRWGRIYVGTGLGVDRLDPQTGHVLHFHAADGLAPGEVQDSVRDRNGDLWFGTLTGLSRLTPRADPPAQAVPSRITGIRVAGRPREIDDEGVSRISLGDLRPGENNIEIGFACSPWAEPGTFEYRLEGGPASEWSAPTTLRTVLYSNLRDGRYRFMARTVTGDGVAGEPAEVVFRILPPMWERWWFIGAVAFILVAAARSAYMYRVSQLLEIERMRTRIACDIHDDVGSAISKIVIMSEVAQRKGADAAIPVLAKISETSNEILDGIGHLVAAINPHTDRYEDVIRRMREFGTQICEARGIEFEFNASDVPLQRKVKPEVLRHLYLVFKEIVNNAAKHSGCSHAKGSLRVERGELILEIADNGHGFDGTPKPGRNGIANLKQRAAALNGDIVWGHESGTTVTLRIPLHDSVGWHR